ncbi:MAG: AAA family ATPase [Thermodesulfobacteriota bacterium]
MITKFAIKNFRTHRDTEIELGPLTLLIGSNNSGKTNLLSALRHFSLVVALGRPDTGDSPPESDDKEPLRATNAGQQSLRHHNLFPHRHRLSGDDEPMSFRCEWKRKSGKGNYLIELYKDESLPNQVGCRERIIVETTGAGSPRTFESGWERRVDWPSLQTQIRAEGLPKNQMELVSTLFRDLAQCYAYHLQPSFLKGRSSGDLGHSLEDPVRIPRDLGYEGSGLQPLLKTISERERRTFDGFLTFMRRFEPSFHGVRFDEHRKELLWEFDIGREPPGLEQFRPDVVSDGLLRAAAIALLCAMHNPPSLILLEEIEDGISQMNIGRFLGWLRKAAGKPDAQDKGYRTQFLVTSHSPSVLRDFADHLEDAYSVRLDSRGYRSVVTNLNESLAYLVDLGGADGETTERDGKKIVRIPPYELVELWYRGTIGGER